MMEPAKIDFRGLITLAYVNLAIWSISTIALVFVLGKYPGVKGFYPIFATGTVIGIILLSRLQKLR